MVSEPRQREVLDLLSLGARFDRIEFLELGLLPIRPPCSLRCSVGLPPRIQEGPAIWTSPATRSGWASKK
jgi:hypothetical protein